VCFLEPWISRPLQPGAWSSGGNTGREPEVRIEGIRSSDSSFFIRSGLTGHGRRLRQIVPWPPRTQFPTPVMNIEATERHGASRVQSPFAILAGE